MKYIIVINDLSPRASPTMKPRSSSWILVRFAAEKKMTNLWLYFLSRIAKERHPYFRVVHEHDPWSDGVIICKRELEQTVEYGIAAIVNEN